MNKIKTFILGGAAAVVAATGAQAADPIMDMKAPREPVYRCDITGFIELPGTDVCFKVGGFARLLVRATDKHFSGDAVGTLPEYTEGPLETWGSFGDGFTMQARGRLNFDARTATEYGTVRAFIELEASDNNTSTGGALNLRHAYVQFGNWLFGKTTTTFQTPGVSPYIAGWTTIGDNLIRNDMIRYTQAFGNGFALSVAIEDPTASLADPGVVIAGPRAIEGIDVIVGEDRDEMPSFVANLSASGDWGTAGLSGVVLRNEVRQWAEIGGVPDRAAGTDSDIGWAVSFGLELNAPLGGVQPGVFYFNAAYGDGASGYVASSWAGTVSGNAVIWGSCGPTVFTNCIVDSVKTWTIHAGYQHFWTPTVNTTIGGGYTNSDYGVVGTSANMVSGDLTALEVDAWDVFANIEWTPVSRTSFLLEARYGHVDYNGTSFGSGPGDVLRDDSDGFGIGFQATRSF